MRRASVCFLLVSLTLFLSFQTAEAQAGFFSSARILEKESMRFGAELVVPDIGLMGHIRYGAHEMFDIGIRTGFLRDDEVTRFQIGFDGRYPFMTESAGDEVDVNFTGLFHLSTGQSITSWSFGVGPQLGKTIPFTNSDLTMFPYIAILLGAIHTSSDGGVEEIAGQQVDIPELSDTSFGVLIPLGAEIQMNEELAFFGEVDISIDGGSDATVAFGINYNYR